MLIIQEFGCFNIDTADSVSRELVEAGLVDGRDMVVGRSFISNLALSPFEIDFRILFDKTTTLFIFLCKLDEQCEPAISVV